MTTEKTNVVDLATFRNKKAGVDIPIKAAVRKEPSDTDLTFINRPPLHTTHAPEFGDRLQRIRASLEKINKLMIDLKKSAQQQEDTTHV